MKIFIPVVILVMLAVIASILLDGSGHSLKAAPTSAPALEQHTITLTALNVTSAIDIEDAARSATATGTRPGIIILDGADGPFVYEGADRTINIFYPNLKFTGRNQAIFINAGDGFFFDDVAIHNIYIEDLFMICEGSGVAGTGQPQNVWLTRNTFQASGVAIAIHRGKDVSIGENMISAGEVGMQIAGSSGITINNNQISAPVGIHLEAAEHSFIGHNTINAARQGISLLNASSSNRVYGNAILSVQQSGIALLPGVQNNAVYENRVLCAPEMACLTIDVASDLAEANQISHNLP